MNISVVIPTFNEPGIGALIERIDAVAHRDGFGLEVVVVDDSPNDSTAAAARAANAECSVVVLHRFGPSAWGGLAGAVLDGLAAAHNDIVVVMDGDGQHPPTVISDLLAAMDSADLTIASRYVGSGEADGLANPFRRVVSSGSTAVARGLFPVRVGRRTTDPMTGFFAVRRNLLDRDAVRAHAGGFKILLAILVTHPGLRAAEVPFTFAEREAGESKAGWRNGMAFLRQIARMRAVA